MCLVQPRYPTSHLPARSRVVTLHTRHHGTYLSRARVDSLPHPSKLDMREACRQELCECSTGVPTRHLQNRVRCQVRIKQRYRFAFHRA